MSNKFIGISIILFGLLIVILIVYVLFFDGFGASSPEPQKPITGDVQTVDNNTEKPEVVSNKIKVNIDAFTQKNDAGEVITPEDIINNQVSSKEVLKRTSLSFAERFGTYSNQSNFHNIKDLNIFMSKNMQVWAENYIFEKIKEEMNREIYYGISTKSTEAEILHISEEEDSASILVKTRRREFVESKENPSDVFEQSIVINYTKENDIWKIDSATWQAR